MEQNERVNEPTGEDGDGRVDVDTPFEETVEAMDDISHDEGVFPVMVKQAPSQSFTVKSVFSTCERAYEAMELLRKSDQYRSVGMSVVGYDVLYSVEDAEWYPEEIE